MPKKTSASRIAYFDCFSGASGDMTLGALVDAGASLAAIARELKRLPLRGYTLGARRVRKGHVMATKVDVRISHNKHEHTHTEARQILAMIGRSKLSERVKTQAADIFTNLARAEGKVHGMKPSEVEFHEVGAVDSIVDIVGVCIALDELKIDRIHYSRLPITTGSVQTQHGTFPIPGPATLELLKGSPVRYLNIEKELVTPTGAAILATLGHPSPSIPEMTLDTVGIGAGDFDLGDRPNILRVLVGAAAAPERSDFLWLLETNLDNTSGETIGYVMDGLFEAGALDVYTTPISMKKSRPAVKLSVLAPESHRARIERIIFRELPTLGIRRIMAERSKLERRQVSVRTPYGPATVKVAALDGEVLHVSPEYEDCRRLARRTGRPLEQISEKIIQAYRNQD